ncbi:F-box/kelch-repeat protein SKIP4 [Andrographis paniculata]|uniref:F-box/kelch-repeat protein SKIP4 n=1 Tax=Andrographis paniculata TaxID=175694 RepID=UPI0021E99EE7|nr:F-box/kelch-repeat protein SKIP4 [Andrographis paniculata]XP_051147365.1 F-box/kelch-repeat protein SKIP4 [Andrographis paniculata]XP_051147366.1 F-box/kelch-repeat protein SKIP4 [Andrographis paniculata]
MSNGMELNMHIIRSENPALLPGLPDDVALCCLARVPRWFHPILNCVSRRWRKLLCGEELHQYRLKHHLEETWVYALCRDKNEQLCMYMLDPNQLKRGWKRIDGLPVRFFKRNGVGFEVLGKKIYLFGGCGWIEPATDEVYCYDGSANMWSRGSSLSTARSFFAYEALDEKIYAIGGIGSESSNPQSWDIYDSHTDHWSSHVDPNVIPEIEDSVVLDGKIYIRCAISPVSSHVCALVYDPSNSTWQHANADMASGWRGPAVVIDGILYVLEQTSGLKLTMWQAEAREWIALRRLSMHLVTPPCRLVAIGKKILVVGKGLGTVMVDIENASCVEGVLLSSSILKLNCDYEVISCKSLSV